LFQEKYIGGMIVLVIKKKWKEFAKFFLNGFKRIQGEIKTVVSRVYEGGKQSMIIRSKA